MSKGLIPTGYANSSGLCFPAEIPARHLFRGHAFTHSLVHFSLIHSFTHSLIHSFTHLVTNTGTFECVNTFTV